MYKHDKKNEYDIDIILLYCGNEGKMNQQKAGHCAEKK